MPDSFAFDRVARRADAEAAVLFVHGLDGDPVKTWAAFPHRMAQAARADVLSLGWRALLADFIAEPAHTAPAVAREVAQALPAVLAPYRRVHLVLHCLGALMMIDALRHACTAGHALPALGALLLDAPLHYPDARAPPWIVRAVDLIGLERAALTAQTAWFQQRHGARCSVARGSDAAWIDHCAPWALGEPGRHHRLALDHLAIAAAPDQGGHRPLELLLSQVTAGEP